MVEPPQEEKKSSQRRLHFRKLINQREDMWLLTFVLKRGQFGTFICIRLSLLFFMVCHMALIICLTLSAPIRVGYDETSHNL